MTSNIQLISLLISFVFGILFYYLTVLNFEIIKSLNIYLKHIITAIYVIDMTIIYAILLYKINNGYFHIYFIMLVIVGYFVGFITNKLYLSKISVKYNIFKLKK